MPNMSIAQENLTLPKGNSPSPVQPDKPQRIDVPNQFNCPKRMSIEESHSQFSNLDSQNTLNCKRRIKDYKMLALSCNRAGKQKDEGRAQFSIGVICDNILDQEEAIDNQDKFLAICKKIKDTNGEALAQNCIGVDQQMMMQRDSDPHLGERAIEFHNLHREIADQAGKFIAHINLGQIQTRMEQQDKSTVNQQFALKQANLLGSKVGETIAICNLGNIGQKNFDVRDNERNKMQLQKQMDLTEKIGDKKGETMALQYMGFVNASEGRQDDGCNLFEQAFEMAEHNHDKKTEQVSKCSQGMANAELKLDNYLSMLVSGSKKIADDIVKGDEKKRGQRKDKENV